MDIEERAEKWAREFVAELNISKFRSLPVMQIAILKIEEILAEAYLAGSAQTQADYSARMSAICDRRCL